MVLKLAWKAVLPSCLKSKSLRIPLEPPKQVIKQTSFRRLSVSDISEPSSLLCISDLSNSLMGFNLHVFTLSELEVITHNFSSSNFLGEGGFGPVYKGFIDDKIRPGLEAQSVAVKILDLEGNQGQREWLAEIIFLGQLRHPHLVKLIGYCCKDDHRLLVYEYIPRGNLEKQLFGRYSLALPWSRRIKIAIGAAKGLAFLHGEEKPVIYRDFKASNILLDTDYTAKISDFGLARDGPEGEQTHVTTRLMGTAGYVAPEYIMTGHLTAMSDVYSFGVVLLELLTGRPAIDKNRPSREQNLVDWARPLLRNPHKLDGIMDPRLEGEYPVEAAKKMAALACQCLSQHPKSRPTMIDVAETLEPLLDFVDIPVRSFMYGVPTEGENGNDTVGKKSKETEKKESRNGTEEKVAEKKENGLRQQKKAHRHRNRLRSSRSCAVHSDTALYKTLRTGFD